MCVCGANNFCVQHGMAILVSFSHISTRVETLAQIVAKNKPGLSQSSCALLGNVDIRTMAVCCLKPFEGGRPLWEARDGHLEASWGHLGVISGHL